MPLRDHFHPPLSAQRHWESLHATWAGSIADQLNGGLLPEGYFAEEQVHRGARVEVDVATYASDTKAPARGNGVATLPVQTWSPPTAAMVLPAAFPDSFEVLVFDSEGGPRLVAAIELISPSNKDRESHRLAFASKCAGYLAQGVALVIADIVTTRRAVLHDDLLRQLGVSGEGLRLPGDPALYAVAYRPFRRGDADQIEVWAEPLAVGRNLPTLPLWLGAELSLPLDLEASYADACRRRRIDS
jgi:Protein of unknown function (DUF4058)